MASLALTSSAFADGAPIPLSFACRTQGGDDLSPPLRVRDVPAGAASLALLYDDPDAGATPWVHWLWWDLDPATVEIAAGATAEALGAVPGTNTGGLAAHAGPCPPSGTHTYVFRMYALDVVLGLPVGSNVAAFAAAIEGHVLAEGQLTGTFTKQ